ncbi:hypothetical protein HZH66_008201 [Vespula vulgaris]|uniref:Uncharacterized protein n=1 Tax=Vespula vulgaris TaxID=7454 RepID=A0A834N3L1_VESVU|nr:hypothetical protein HZH66_008201 [Vespula vulgaris]
MIGLNKVAMTTTHSQIFESSTSGRLQEKKIIQHEKVSEYLCAWLYGRMWDTCIRRTGEKRTEAEKTRRRGLPHAYVTRASLRETKRNKLGNLAYLECLLRTSERKRFDVSVSGFKDHLMY